MCMMMMMEDFTYFTTLFTFRRLRYQIILKRIKHMYKYKNIKRERDFYVFESQCEILEYDSNDHVCVCVCVLVIHI